MRPFRICFFLAALLLVVLVWFGRRLLSCFYPPVTHTARVVDKRIVVAARAGGLASKRRETAFRLADDATLTLAASRRVFADCPHRAAGQLTLRGRCFIQNGSGGGTVGRPARTGGRRI